MQKKIILLVAMQSSVHTARWVNQIVDQGWKVFIFSSANAEPMHPDINGVFQVYSFPEQLQVFLNGMGLRFMAWLTGRLLQYWDTRYPGLRVSRLERVIRKLRPDLIHSLEIQNAGYLTLEAKRLSQKYFPKWIVTNWGSDIFLFGRLQAHRSRIQEVLANCNYYSCECQRDVKLAHEFGFSGTVLPIFPNTGGFELRQAEKMRQMIPPSARKTIMLKGYQHWSGRALFGLRALERCKDILNEYTIIIYSAPPEVQVAAELFTYRTGIATRIVAQGTPHHEMLALHAMARVSVGLSISDAISTSLLEAMVMGSFPIQSCTACADEWLQHGLSGLIVPPEDTDVIETAIRTALSDDLLVDRAAVLNWQVVTDRLDASFLKQKAVNMYRSILG